MARTDDKAFDDWAFEEYQRAFNKALREHFPLNLKGQDPEGGYLVTEEMATKAHKKAMKFISDLDN